MVDPPGSESLHSPDQYTPLTERELMLIKLVDGAPALLVNRLLNLFMAQPERVRALCLLDDDIMGQKISSAVQILHAQDAAQVASLTSPPVTPSPSPIKHR